MNNKLSTLSSEIRGPSFFGGLLLRTAVTCAMLSVTACEIFPTKQIDSAIESFDRAIGALSQESADWRVVVTDLQEEVTQDMQSTIRNEVENLTRDAVLTAGGELRCNAEFMRIKLERELRGIRNDLVTDINNASWSLFGQNLIPLLPEIPVEPFICDAVPSAIDLHVSAERRAKVDIFGFDLRSLPITAHLITQGNLTVREGTLDAAEYLSQIEEFRVRRANRTASPDATAVTAIAARTFTLASPSSRLQKDISSALAVISDFHAVLDLTESGVEVTPNSKTIALSWNGIAQSHIPVLAHQQVVECTVKTVERRNLGTQNFVPPYSDNECEGSPDRDFKGHGPCVYFEMRLHTDAAKRNLIARYFMDAWECPDDFGKWRKDCTQAKGWGQTTLFTAAENQEILGYDVDSYVNYSYIDKDHGTDPRNFGGAEPITRLVFKGDRGGDDVEVFTAVDMSFRSLNVRVEECELK